jgi:MoaA/NifB/PqqE/SkfB family radical SAM enzyme
MTPNPFRVGLVLTYRCNAECQHCFFECSPSRTEVMTRKTAQRVINEALSLGTEWVSFSGGEPFLENGLLYDLITLSRGMGLKTEVVTNGFWGKTEEEARGTLLPLIEAGLDVLNLSVDDFHGEYVPFESARNSYRAAVGLGLNVVLMVSTDKDSKITSGSLPGLLGDDRVQVAGKRVIIDPNAVLFETQFTPVGRGVSLEYDPVQFSEIRCNEVLKDIGVAPNGEVLPCCGPLGAKTVLGNINDEGLGVILERAGRDPRYKRISEGLNVDGSYSSRCHACIENQMGEGKPSRA